MNELRDISKMTDAERAVEGAIEIQTRSRNCMIEIENILKRWNCKIEPVITLSSQGIQGNWGITPIMAVKIQ